MLFCGCIGLLEAKENGKTQWLSDLCGLLPYNPIMVETRGYEGESAALFAKLYPNGYVIVFEPDTTKVSRIEETTANCHNVHIENAFLGSRNQWQKGNPIYTNKNFRFVNLDSWCQENDVDHIDLIRLDIQGNEIEVLRSFPKVLSKARVISIRSKSILHGNKFFKFQQECQNLGFTIKSHGVIDKHEIILIRNDIYNALYR